MLCQRIHQWLPLLWGQSLDTMKMLSHPFRQGSLLSISFCSSSMGHCKFQPHQTKASILDKSGIPRFRAFRMPDVPSLPFLPYSPTFSQLTSTYPSGFSLLQKAVSAPTKLGQVALSMLLHHFVPGSLMILNCTVCASAIYFPSSPLSSKLHRGRDHFCLAQCLAEANF